MKHGFPIRLLSYGLRVGLLLLAITTAGVLVFGSPDTLKESLQESGAYTTASARLSKQAGQAVSEQANLKVDQNTVEIAAQQSFPPQTIQTSAEQIIDDSYAWLQGTTDKPNIRLDLSPYADSFVQSVGDQAQQRVEGLPVCTLEQVRQIDPNNINVFGLSCRPPGVNLGEAKQQAITQAIASNDFLQNPVISSDSLPKDSEGKTALDRADSLPQAFQWLMLGPWAFGGLALICASLIMWLLWRDGWRVGVSKLARSLLGVGITLLILIGIVKLLFRFATSPDGLASRLADGDFREVVVTFIKSLEHAYNAKLLVFGIVYAAAAALVLLALRFWKPATPIPEPVKPGPNMPAAALVDQEQPPKNTPQTPTGK